MSSYPRQEGFPAEAEWPNEYRIQMPNQPIEGADQELEDRRNRLSRRRRNSIICVGIFIAFCVLSIIAKFVIPIIYYALYNVELSD